MLRSTMRLTNIYIPHDHGVHFFELTHLRQHWHDVKIVATKGTVENMIQQIQPARYDRESLVEFLGKSPSLLRLLRLSTVLHSIWRATCCA